MPSARVYDTPVTTRDTRILDDWQREASSVVSPEADGIAIPEIEEAIKFAYERPDVVTQVFLAHQRLFEYMISMTEEELAITDEAENILRESGVSSSASHHTLREFLGMMTPRGRQQLSRAVSRMHDPDGGEVYVEALARFASMLSGGHQLALEGRQPRDGDPDFDTVIWGHTQIDGYIYPGAMLHFLVAHFMERYICEALQREDIEIGHDHSVLATEISEGKDAVLNALGSALLLREVIPPLDYAPERRGGLSHRVMMLHWQTPKEVGGLGWIEHEQIEAYREAYQRFRDRAVSR